MDTGRVELLLDATVLSNFLLVGRVDLLQKIPITLGTVPEVIQEIQKGFELGKVPQTALDWLPVIPLNRSERRIFRRLCASLGMGESAAIAVCQKRNLKLATDDFDARLTAIQLGIPITGTVGLLLICVRQGILSENEADSILSEMIQNGYRAPVHSLSELNQV